MTIARIEVGDHAAFGRLVKKWAKGELPREEDPAKMVAQAVAEGAGLSLPPRIKKVTYVVQDLDTMYVVIPPEQMLTEAEEALAQGDPYGLPDFYIDDFACVQPTLDAKKNDAAFNKDLHDKRIGDYVTAQCA